MRCWQINCSAFVHSVPTVNWNETQPKCTLPLLYVSVADLTTSYGQYELQMPFSSPEARSEDVYSEKFQSVWKGSMMKYVVTKFSYTHEPKEISDRNVYFTAWTGGISMAYCKNAVTPLLTHWSYYSFVLSHQFYVCFYEQNPTLRASIRKIIIRHSFVSI